MTGGAVPVVLVTGAAGGIGAAAVRRFASGGWRVVATDLTAPVGPEIEHSIDADLTRVAECRRLVAEVVAATGRLDCLVNSAGVWTEGPVELTEEAAYDLCLNVNLKGLFFTTAAAVPHLITTSGCIVNLSSDAGLQGNTGAAVYCASKGAVSNLTRALALELASRGVRVNAVCPSDVDTPMLAGQARNFGGDDPAAYLESLLALYPQRATARFAQPAEVAELIWYLAQRHAAPITGANLSIDFGLTAGR
jgi:NAD(P)-dependent dehydrogenase (short-subunit alcohol dehydrogenase family)